MGVTVGAREIPPSTVEWDGTLVKTGVVVEYCAKQ